MKLKAERPNKPRRRIAIQEFNTNTSRTGDFNIARVVDRIVSRLQLHVYRCGRIAAT